MLFLNPMWQDDIQRLGKRCCTPTGYFLHILSDIVGIFGFLILLGILVDLPLAAIAGTFRVSLLWWLLVPVLIDFCGDLLYSGS